MLLERPRHRVTQCFTKKVGAEKGYNALRMNVHVAGADPPEKTVQHSKNTSDQLEIYCAQFPSLRFELL